MYDGDIESLGSAQRRKPRKQYRRGNIFELIRQVKLLDVMEKLGERLLYFDTDSIIFIQKPGQWEPPMGISSETGTISWTMVSATLSFCFMMWLESI